VKRVRGASRRSALHALTVVYNAWAQAQRPGIVMQTHCGGAVQMFESVHRRGSRQIDSTVRCKRWWSTNSTSVYPQPDRHLRQHQRQGPGTTPTEIRTPSFSAVCAWLDIAVEISSINSTDLTVLTWQTHLHVQLCPDRQRESASG
jgi:hypothetical protein